MNKILNHHLLSEKPSAADLYTPKPMAKVITSICTYDICRTIQAKPGVHINGSGVHICSQLYVLKQSYHGL